jgi:hypothetical protein
LVTHPPVIKDGHLSLPMAAGWGADINEEVLRQHPWPARGSTAPMFYGMTPQQMAATPASSRR